MRAYVLAGGYGSRLRSRIGDRPKILAPFRGRPFLETQVEWLATAGVEEIVLCLGIAAEPVLEHLGTRAAGAGPRLRAVREAEPLGTGGAVAFAASGETERFLVVNGDTLAHFSLGHLWEWHEAREATVTLACYRVADVSAKGSVEIDDAGLVTAFREKAASGSGWISGGVYACEPAVLEHLPATRPLSLETEVFPALLRAGRRVAAWPAEGRIFDIGTPAGLDEAEEAWTADATRGPS